eukprot:CCRYP_009929-RA/>CCRYP_009929-RA protein AED:0.00 eAED:0.00 QI:293/1/0.5/1/0/0/2/0/134
MEERSSLPDTKLQLSCVVMADREEWSNDAMGDRERQRSRLVKIHTTTGYNNHNSYPCQPQQQQQPRMEGSACNMQSNSTYQKFESIIKKSTTTTRKTCRSGKELNPHCEEGNYSATAAATMCDAMAKDKIRHHG